MSAVFFFLHMLAINQSRKFHSAENRNTCGAHRDAALLFKYDYKLILYHIIQCKVFAGYNCTGQLNQCVGVCVCVCLYLPNGMGRKEACSLDDTNLLCLIPNAQTILY